MMRHCIGQTFGVPVVIEIMGVDGIVCERVLREKGRGLLEYHANIKGQLEEDKMTGAT